MGHQPDGLARKVNATRIKTGESWNRLECVARKVRSFVCISEPLIVPDFPVPLRGSGALPQNCSSGSLRP